jgi:EmrB/QacA subfamily drug resistance transporter
MNTSLSYATAARTDRRQWVALAVVLVAALVDAVDVTVVHVAIPTIQRDVHAPYAAVQWIVAGYALAFALGLITGGRLGDVYGRKRVFLAGLAGFTVASLLAGIATGPGVLIAARLLQGAMAAVMVPQVLATIHVTFSQEARGKAFAIYGATLGVGVVSGPVIGGLLVTWNLFGLGWRPIFLVNLPLGIAGLVLGRRFIRESRAEHPLRLDLPGVGWVAAGLFGLIFPLTEGGQLGWPWWAYLMLAGSVPVLAGFVLYQRVKSGRQDSPLVELSLFRARSFSAGLSVQLLSGLTSGLFFLSWTFYMQTGLGWSPLHAALTGLPLALGIMASSGLSMQLLVPRFGRRVLQAGALLTVAGLAIYLGEAHRYSAGIASWQMILPLGVMGLGMGLVMAPLTDLTITGVPHADAGSASGLMSTAVQVGLALGIALSSVTYFGALGGHTATTAAQIAPQLREQLIAAQTPAPQADAMAAWFQACTTAAAGQDGPAAIPAACRTSPRANPAVTKILAGAGRQASRSAYSVTFANSLWYVMAGFAAMFILMSALPMRARQAPEAAAPDGG